MFNWILDDAKESGRFPYQVLENGGNDPLLRVLRVLHMSLVHA
jgi:hypothetical protein